MDHTPEPWKTDAYLIVAEVPSGRPGGEVIVQCTPTVSRVRSLEQDKANARRIVAAVNACVGISTEALEDGVIEELVEALRQTADGFHGVRNHSIAFAECRTTSCRAARNTIAKARGTDADTQR
jgi:hypothetical protein